MPRNTQLSEAVVNEQAEALARRLSGGYLRIYDGEQPLSADTLVTQQRLLAELRFDVPAAPPVAGGVIAFHPLRAETPAQTTGKPTWFRALQADGKTVVMDGTAGEASQAPNLVLSEKMIVAGAIISLSSFTHAIQKATEGL